MTRQTGRTDAERLLELSEQVNRVADSLAQLAVGRVTSNRADANAGEFEASEEIVDRLIHVRSERARYLPSVRGLLTDPVWDMLLFLLRAETTRRPVSVSEVCAATDTPPGVGARWLDAMNKHGLIALKTDSDDIGGAAVELEAEVSRALRRYLGDVVQR